MPLQNFQYDTIMREYSRRQAQNHRILEEHTAEAYGKIPRLKEIDDEVATLSADKVRRLLNGEEKGTSDLKAAIQELSDERITLLVANGFPGDYLEMPYTCPDCQDTGYIGSRKCTCFKKAEIELLYAQSNLNEILEKENFDSFSFDYYSATIKNEATGLSALKQPDGPMTLHSALCRTSTINLKTCFYMVIPVWEKPFFHTASPESFSDPPTVSCTFPPTIFLI